ncbi:uncharacterized protein BDV17DRAFT_251091 [Aspergillus undulatus]|uniref:uncharacterized protein n=1 Tax=Aspergillus undulatus TaxID=1810928 RepID=UPI003CCDF73B
MRVKNASTIQAGTGSACSQAENGLAPAAGRVTRAHSIGAGAFESPNRRITVDLGPRITRSGLAWPSVQGSQDRGPMASGVSLSVSHSSPDR